MASLISVAKIVTGRLYPVLVWGALMGLAVHAGLKAQFHHLAPEFSEQVTLSNESSATVKIPVRMEDDASDRMQLL